MTFALTILGSNSAYPTSNRYPTAHVLNVHERFFLIDCGEGAQIQLRKTHTPFARINHIFISHLHGDHYFGLYGLISTFGLLGRKNPLHIYAHANLEKILNQPFSFFDEPLAFPLIFHPLQYDGPHEIFSDKSIKIISFPLKHRIPTCGFLFREQEKDRNIIKEMLDFLQIPIRDIVQIKKGADYTDANGKVYPNSVLTRAPANPRSYAFVSDTAYNESIIPVIKGVNLLYHEATFKHEMAERARQTLHSTTQQAAEIAKKADAGKLIIGHFSARFRDAEEMVNEAKSIFANTVSADDGQQYIVD